jgi:hypothetical protein
MLRREELGKMDALVVVLLVIILLVVTGHANL